MGFIYVGRLDELKGIRILFRAWKQMGNDAPELKICGIGPLEAWCKEYIVQNNISTIDMLGFVKNEEIKKLMANSNALILPTQWYEGFPMTIIEAYSVGTPVICSDLGNTGCVVEEGVTGYKFEVGSTDSLISSVKKMIMNPIDRDNVISQYVNKYSEDVNYELLESIYDLAV